MCEACPSATTSEQTATPTEEPEVETCGTCDQPEDECRCFYCEGCHESADSDTECQCSNCERCESCCECRVCERRSCSETVSQEDYCSDCRMCNNCCECVRCGNCGENCTDDYCPDCSNCQDCCDCDADSDPGAPFHTSDPRKHNKRLVGLEIEYNTTDDRCALAYTVRKWRMGDHHDGSCGREVVTAPMSGEHIDLALKDLCKTFKDTDTKADEKCGVHVHVDATDYTWADMYKLLRVYAKVEPFLYLLGGQHRVKNTYCAPTGKDYHAALLDSDRKGSVLAAAYDQSSDKSARDYVKHNKPGKKNGGRYKGLNICPWLSGRRGKKRAKDTTVEFRLHRNCLDADRLTGWAHLLADLVEYCAKASDKEINALPKSAMRALCVISPKSREWITRRVMGWRSATTTTRDTDYIPRRIGLKNGEYYIRSV